MVSSLAPNLPPVKLSDSALKLASTLLQIAVDPNATSARLAELAAQTQVLRDAIASNETTAARASDVEAQQAAVTAKEQDVASREAALTAAQTQLQVASATISDRDAAVTAKEAASDKREADITARQTALEQRIAGYRSALGA
jgi:hypothetical protein